MVRAAGSALTEVATDINSQRTRVRPVFGWLREFAGDDWGERLLVLAKGIQDVRCGRVLSVDLEREHEEPAAARRLAWMLENRDRLTPRKKAAWIERRKAIDAHPELDDVIARLKSGDATRIPPKLRLEGRTHADCLIRCEHLIMWIEGKRTDWIAEGTDWDNERDQLARNLEAAAAVARREDRDFCVIVCHETDLRRDEARLVEGYREGTLVSGMPHLDVAERARFRDRIGTVTWSAMADEWRPLSDLAELADLSLT